MKKYLAILLIISMVFSMILLETERYKVLADGQPIWPMFRYDSGNTGQCPYNTAQNGGSLKWKLNMQGLPTIGSDGTIYILSNYLYAINPDNGTIKVRYPDGEGLGLSGSPAIAQDGTIYCGSYDCLWAFSPDGKPKWKTQLYMAGGLSSPVIGPDETIYIHGYGNGNLYAIDHNGNIKWSLKAGWMGQEPAISKDNIIYVSGIEVDDHLYNVYYVYALNSEGTIKWKHNVGGIIYSSLVVSSSGIVYAPASTPDGVILCAMNSNGILLWEKSFPSLTSCHTTPAVGKDCTIYLGADYIYALNSDGSTKWKFSDGFSDNFSSPVVSADGIVYSLCYSAGPDGLKCMLYAINPDGTLRWKYEKGGNLLDNNCVIIGTDGTIYVSNNDIHALYSTIGQYTIKSTSSIGGSISPTGLVRVESRDTEVFNIIPDLGYKIKDVIVDGVSKGAVSTYTFANITQDHTISAIFEKRITDTVIILKVGSKKFTVSGEVRTLDYPPIIKNDRTLVPIRAIVEAFGGKVDWEPAIARVNISLDTHFLYLQIGNPFAGVDGDLVQIDPLNSSVVPEIINGRTMLPLRFVAESLGCTVDWDGTTKTITIRYSG
ncbi:MAG: PQQ-binding-like beta-propeller repeat protein [Caldisericia bacterium]|nr:PQQ-binding-like beta-propeller repeat protein [Caldisericia bacterium]